MRRLLYLITLHAAWCCTGDRDLLKRHLPVAERCLEWIDECGDRDGDGFQEYATRASAGLENQGWKDSGDALLYPDGTPVKGPKALCELQGYVYDAWLRMAEIYQTLGDGGRAAKLRAKAATLFEHFNEAFWDEEIGFYAFALDGDKNKVLSIASNPGHCLWSGIVPDAPHRRLYVDPVLPGWLSDLTVRDLRVGDQSFDIRFWRADEQTRFEVLKGDPAAVTYREMTAWSELLKCRAREAAA